MYSNAVHKVYIKVYSTHPLQGLNIVEAWLGLEGMFPLEEGHEAAAPAQAGQLVPQYI